MNGLDRDMELPQPPPEPTSEAQLAATHGSVANFVCEVGIVNTETRTTGWRKVARYTSEEQAMDFVACNSHCVCRYRKETPLNAKLRDAPPTTPESK